MPWGLVTPEAFDIVKARAVLDEEHYGLEDVKDRILEFIAVGKLLGEAPRGRILCLVGPPGVGKTSIARSIANSLGRKFFRFRYVHSAGSGTGDVYSCLWPALVVCPMSLKLRAIVALISVQCPESSFSVLNLRKQPIPLFSLMRSTRWDVASKAIPALRCLRSWIRSRTAPSLTTISYGCGCCFRRLVLTTSSCQDAPVDLSKVLFICTANTEESIPRPLADRIEFIRLSGYIHSEKVNVSFLCSSQRTHVCRRWKSRIGILAKLLGRERVSLQSKLI